MVQIPLLLVLLDCRLEVKLSDNLHASINTNASHGNHGTNVLIEKTLLWHQTFDKTPVHVNLIIIVVKIQENEL